MSGRGGAAGLTRTAPSDLAPPDRLLATLRTTDRTEHIDRHGFGHTQLKPAWWLRRGITIHLPSNANDEPVLTCGDLFRWRTTSSTTTRYSPSMLDV